MIVHGVAFAMIHAMPRKFRRARRPRRIFRRRRPRPASILLLALVLLGFWLANGQQGLRERITAEWPRAIPPGAPAAAPTAPSAPAAPTPSPTGDASIRVYFAPDPPGNGTGPDDVLIQLIASARSTVFCAFYDLELVPVADALIAQHRAGRKVALVSDTTYNRRAAVNRVIDAGIPVVFDERNDFMHNKFCVVDGATVWTGSTNITQNCMYRNDNNALVIQSSALAENYTAEFDEMFGAKRFGPRSPSRTPNPVIKLGEFTTIENYFAPEDDVQEKILEQIRAARREILFMAFAFTSDPIAEAMIDAMREGVQVRGVLEARNVNDRACEDDRLRDAGATVYVDSNPNNMHNKIIVIDEATVITGSYNFSRNADENNDENILFINDRALALQYTAYFAQLVGTP